MKKELETIRKAALTYCDVIVKDLEHVTAKQEKAILEGSRTINKLLKHAERNVPNTYKVSEKEWKKWDVDEREVFNSVYKSALSHQDIINPATAEDPQDKIPHKLWKVLVWNIAWLTASNMRAKRRAKQK
jgi:hypothetical protein